MKIFEAEVAPSGKTRICFSVGYDEIEILHGLVSLALRHMPDTHENNSQLQTMRNMNRAMSVYLGKSKGTTPKSSDFPCPKCNRKLRGDKAVANHLRDVHGGDQP